MPAEEDSFLPSILSVFFAAFDQEGGPTILYQVPEGLIANSSSALDDSSKTSATEDTKNILFHFDDISKYIIPTSALCGRLVTCTTRYHRIMGFPVALRGKYLRNWFRFNISFVFERAADLSCFEPIIRKVGRVMTACEEESNFLSSPVTSPFMAQILEQLYEDLNSYAESSIAINNFNSLDLKVFPFYPNPPPVNLWDVPVALINLTKRIEPNWDMTMALVCKWIDGVNSVSRIASFAETDEELARQAMAHLLYYQCIMMIDIFQYSNMYTVTKKIRWLAEEKTVQDECGPYVTHPGYPILDWPHLLRLYARFKAGTTVFQWQEDNNISELGIDVRRFTSFGVIKGFLRRVHRWPYLLPPAESPELPSPPRKRQPTLLAATNSGSSLLPLPEDDFDLSSPISMPFAPSPEDRTLSSAGSLSTLQRRRRTRELTPAEAYAEQVSPFVDSRTPPHTIISNPITPSSILPIRRRSSQAEYTRSSILSTSLDTQHQPSSQSSNPMSLTRPHLSRSPSSLGPSDAPYPSGLAELLNGEHHTDELATRFGCGWPTLEKYLIAIGEGNYGDYGRVKVICR